MKLNMYSIYDTAASAYTSPFFMHNDGLAIRAFQDNANTAESQINKHPRQFHLYKVAVWDDSNATIKTHEPECIAYAHELVNPNETQTVADEIKKMLRAVEDMKFQLENSGIQFPKSES